MKNDIIFNEGYFLHYCMHPEQTKNSVFIVSNLGLNCKCMSRFDTSGTSKNDNLLKVLVGHGVKKYGIKIFFRGLQAELCPFVYIL